MARPASSQPTDVELRILRILWESGPCTAREVHNSMAEDKQTNYSTTVKMLSVMFDKGLVTRDEVAYPMTFTAAISQQQTQQTVLSDMIRKLYDGSAKSLVMQVLSSQESSAADLAEIRRLIEQLDAARPGSGDQPKKRR
ncbi:MAG: BlaI/MecI/CopY family transcriptional regulator [Planctomycetota bacterium]